MNVCVTPVFSQIHVLPTFRISSFPLEAREEYTGDQNICFNSRANPRSRNSSMAPAFDMTSCRTTHFLSRGVSRFWTSTIEIEALNGKEYSPELTVIVTASSNTPSLRSATICTLIFAHTARRGGVPPYMGYIGMCGPKG